MKKQMILLHVHMKELQTMSYMMCRFHHLPRHTSDMEEVVVEVVTVVAWSSAVDFASS